MDKKIKPTVWTTRATKDLEKITRFYIELYGNSKAKTLATNIRLKTTILEREDIDTSKNSSISEISKLIRPNDKPDILKNEYETGKSSRTFEKNTSSFSERDIRDAIVLEDDRKTVSNLKALGVDIEATGILNDVVKYKGIEYDAENKKELEKLVNKIIEDKKGGVNSTNNASRFNKK